MQAGVQATSNTFLCCTLIFRVRIIPKNTIKMFSINSLKNSLYLIGKNRIPPKFVSLLQHLTFLHKLKRQVGVSHVETRENRIKRRHLLCFFSKNSALGITGSEVNYRTSESALMEDASLPKVDSENAWKLGV